MLRLHLFLVCIVLTSALVLPATFYAQQSKFKPVSPMSIDPGGDPPPAPVLQTPANGATDQPTSLTLSWSEVPTAETYRMQLSTNSSFTAPLVLDDASLTLPSRDVSSLSYSTTYWWRVRAANEFGSSGWSSTWSFTTQVAPPPPPEQSCGTQIESQQTQIGGEYVTSFGTIKALFIFIDFSDDKIDSANATWPVGAGPNYMNDIIDSTEAQNSGKYANLSTFFKDMSYGQFKMIGKAYYVQAPHPLSWYQSNHHNSEAAYSAQDAIQILDQSVDFSDYDRWIDSRYNHTLGSDGILDMVFIGYRQWYICQDPKRPFCSSFISEGWWGASLPADVYVDNGARRIVSTHAVDNTVMIQYPRFEHVVHEFGHAWGLNHQYSRGMWSLMGARRPNNGSFMNSFERAQLGWISFRDVTTSQTATLRDFGTYGDAYRLSLGSGQYFLIENHQRLSPYDDPDITGAKGLYVLRQFTSGYSCYEANLKVDDAAGRFNWSIPYWTIFPGTNVNVPVFQRGTRNGNAGNNKKDMWSLVDPSTGGTGCYDVIAKIDEHSGQTVYGSFYKGDGNDAFDVGTNTVLSPWSNPAACSQGGTLANFGFELLQLTGGAYNVQFFIGNPQNASPAKPQNLSITSVTVGNTILSWAPNLEPDLVGYNVYRCLDTGTTDPAYVKINSSVIVGSTYTDNNYESVGGLPQNVDLYHRYRITAVDNQGKESIRSEYTRAYFTHVASGTLTTNRTWQIDVQVPFSLIVNTGVTLNVSPTTSVRFSSSAILTVSGKLIALGTPSQRIVFTSSNSNPQPGNWEGITCAGGPDTLQYCTIQYARTGVAFYSGAQNSYMAYDTVSYCNTNYDGVGVYAANTSTATPTLKLYKCVLRNNNKTALQVYNAKVYVSSTKIDSNGGQWGNGVSIYAGGKVYFDSSRIQYNILDGVLVDGVNSRASLSVDEVKPGYNTIQEHGMDNIELTNSATCLLGYTASIQGCCCSQSAPSKGGGEDHYSPLGGGCQPGCWVCYSYQPRAGWNNVINSATYVSYRDVNNHTSTTVNARYTYWGTPSQQSGSPIFNGPVDSAYQLSGAVYTPSQRVVFLGPLAAATTIGEEEMSTAHSSTVGERSEQVVNSNTSGDVSDEDMIAWLTTLQDDIDSNRSNSIDALHQLALHTGPNGRFPQALRMPWDIFLLTIQVRPNLPVAVRRTAAAMRVQSILDQAHYQAAIDLSDELLDSHRFEDLLSDDLWLFLQTRKLLAYGATRDTATAWSLFNGIASRARTIDSAATAITERYLTAIVGSNTGSTIAVGSGFIKPNDDIGKQTPKEFSLSQNYPNPFNPATTIQYTLPENSHVHLTIYNVLGEEVARLVDEDQDVGYKQARFEVSGIPSGIYFYQLKAGSFTDIKKMVVLK